MKKTAGWILADFRVLNSAIWCQRRAVPSEKCDPKDLRTFATSWGLSLDMHLSFGRRHFWIISAIAIVLLVRSSRGQRAGQQPILVCHDVIDGPTVGAHEVEDLKVLASGSVTYTVRSKATKSYTFKMKADDVSGLVQLLDRPEIRTLPSEVKAKSQPVDFFWDQKLQIVRSGATQDVHIEHFYPFLNLNGSAYPQQLIAFECKLRDIKAAATKQSQNDGNWCEDLLAHKLPESESYKCNATESKMKIAEGAGWGPVQIGASFRSIQAALGKATPSEEFSDIHFVEYRSRGVEISLNRADDKVHAIYFYNHQQGSGQFGVFCGQTSKGINWNSTIDDVRNAYGHPSADFIRGNSSRLQFPGIDFRFENGKLVRIGIPGN